MAVDESKVLLTLQLPTASWVWLERIWRWLKRRRKIRIGPFALQFAVTRDVPLTKIPRNALAPSFRLHDRSETRPQSQPDDQRIALIVGVGPGLGHSLAKCLAIAEGFTVVLASRRAHRLDGLVQDICDNGGRAAAYSCDSTSESSVRELFRKTVEQHGNPSLVIYAVQYFSPGEGTEIELPAFVTAWESNCLGAFLVAREAAHSMARFHRGTIILVGSTSSLIGRAGHLNLAVGKFGQRALAQVLARELWPKGIHVAHLVIDADIAENEDHGEIQSDPDHIASVILSLHQQRRTAWSSEIDVRPWNERFWEHC